jgi:4-amino-4-deoxy-L-arabinose transferase-like glycosyltransferase
MGIHWLNQFSKRPYSSLTLVIVFAAGIRLYLLWQYFCISSDGVRYIDAAQYFYSGKAPAGFSSIYPPLYSLMIAALYTLIGDWEWTGQILSIVAGVVVLVPLFVLLKKIYDDEIALIACLLAAMAPHLAHYSVHVRTEAIYILLSTVALLLFHTGIKNPSRFHFFYGGLIVGLAYLVRFEAIGFLVIIPIWLFVEWRFGKTLSLGGVFLGSVVTLLGFLVFTSLFMAYLPIDTGAWVTISRKINVTLLFDLQNREILNDDGGATILAPGEPGIVGLFLAHPLRFIGKIALDIPRSFATYLVAVHYSYILFLLAGMLAAVRRKPWPWRDSLLFTFVIFYILGFGVILVHLRHETQLIAASLGWVAMGLLWCANYDHFKRFLSPKVFNISVIAMGLVFVGGTLGTTLQPISREKAYVRDAGRHLKHLNLNRDTKLKVAALDNRIPFYAEAEWVDMSTVTDSALRAYLQEHKPRYVAVETKPWQRYFPNAAKRPAEFGLSLENEFIGTRGDRLLVFNVKF